MSPTRVELSADVAFRELNGEGVLLDLGSGTYFGLNEVGTKLWSLLTTNDSLENATEALVPEYDVAADVLRADVNHLLQEMQANGLLQLQQISN